MTALSIRTATAADAGPAAALLRASIAALCTADHRGDPAAIARWCANKTPDTLVAWIADPGGRILIAERGGAMAGVGGLGWNGEIRLTYVAPAARFSGVGRALLAAMEAALRDAGHTDAHLESTLTAVAFHRAAGWQSAGRPVEMFGLPGQPMRKRLALA